MEMMKKLGDRHHRLLHLPEDIIVFKILVRLPVVEVIRCTSVCKQWYALIKTPLFISTHLSLSSSSSSSGSSQPWVFVDLESSTLRRRVLSSHSEPQSFQEDCRPIPFPFPVASHGVVLGPIHGLFFLYSGSPLDIEKFYCLWNPAVRSYIPLPSPTFTFWGPTTTIIYGFAFDAKSEDFMVLACKDFFSRAPDWQLFSLKQGSWRKPLSAAEELLGNYHCIASGSGDFINGALHWVVKEFNNGLFHCFVLAFDIADETFKGMELPQEQLQAFHQYGILEVKGSFACFDYACKSNRFWGPQGINCYSIWVMEEYGVANSWVKMWTIQLMGSTLSWVYGFWGNGNEILLRIGDYTGDEEVFLYDTMAQEAIHFGGDAKPYIYNICSYSESLILLDKESGAVSYDEPTPLSEDH